MEYKDKSELPIIQQWIEETAKDYGDPSEEIDFITSAKLTLIYLGLQDIEDPKKYIQELSEREELGINIDITFKSVDKLSKENLQYKTAIAEQAVSHTKQIEKLEAENERMKEVLEKLQRINACSHFGDELIEQTLKGE